MLRRRVFAGVFSFVYLAAALVAALAVAFAAVGAFADDPAGLPELDPLRIGAQPVAAEPVDEQRVWIEQTGPDMGQTVAVSVKIADEQNALLPLVFQCDLKAIEVLSTAFLTLTVTDPAGTVLHRDEVQVYIGQEPMTYSLAWDMSAVPTGVYKATFAVAKLPRLPVTAREYVVKKVSRSQLVAMADDAQAKLASVLEGVRAMQAAGQKPPYILARAAIAEDCAAYMRQGLANNPWRTSDRLIRYILTTADAVRAQITFLNELPEFAQAVPEPDTAHIQLKDGVVYAGARPAFLFGKNFGENRPADELRRMRSYGLNAAGITVAPKDTLASESADADFKAQVDPVLNLARENNIGLFVALDPATLPDWAVQKWPDLMDPVLNRVNITRPEARQLIERHFKAAIPYLSGHEAVAALSVATAPQFRFLGEDVRQGFIAHVKTMYADRHVLNQAWRSLFSRVDEIATGWDAGDPRFKRSERYIEKAAYQYDWQIYHQQLGTQYLQGMTAFARSLAGDTPLAAAFGGDILEKSESQFGLDREAVGGLFDLIGCCAANSIYDAHYAIGYPQQPLLYTLLQSLAPGKPLVNFSDGVIPPYDPSQPCTFDYVHTAMWEAAMAGLNASMLTIDDWMANPECLDGYVTASIDLNRLADVIAAFQTAPAQVAILWSMPSKIFNGGDPFLESIKFAYEGTSFGGYKVRFISEDQINAGELAKISVLVLPETPAVKDETFTQIKTYIQNDGAVIRTAVPILFNEHGQSRRDVITTTPRTVLLRGQNLPTEYLHSMDAVISVGTLPMIPRAINPFGYPLEGVKTRYVEHNGSAYLYAVNLRKTPVECHLAGGPMAGRDLIHGQDISFPATLQPLQPVLVKLDAIPKIAPPTAPIRPPEVPPQE
ncbi:MAG: beta-galactosidase [Candidatus Hydrogenedentes bacterium]|nr:beta-galactosidase [Candidatus Hydrogenedentota bacterium]